MANAFTQAFYDKITGDTDITNRLSTYSDDDGNSNPAVFTSKEIPGDAETPWIHTYGQVTDDPFDAKNANGRNFDRDILVADTQDGSSKDVEEIAELVRDLFHESTLSVSGYEQPINMESSGPIPVSGVPVDEGEKNLDARVVTVSVTIMQESS